MQEWLLLGANMEEIEWKKTTSPGLYTSLIWGKSFKLELLGIAEALYATQGALGISTVIYYWNWIFNI